MRIPILTIIIIYIITFLELWYLNSDIRRYSKGKKGRLIRIIFYIVSSAMLIYITAVLSLPRRSADNSIIHVMWMLYGYLSIVASLFIYIIFSFAGRLIAGKRHINYGIFAGGILGIALLITFWWGAFVTRNEIEVRHVVMKSDKLPQSFDGFKIVQISDLHTGTWGNDTTFLSQLVDSINAQNPDIILFTGDIVNRRTSELAPFMKTLSRLYATHGVYSVLGNHDYGEYIEWARPADKEENNALLAEWEKQMGWDLLKNEHRFIRQGNDSIALIGVENWGDPPFGQLGDLNLAYPAKGDSQGLYDSNFKILMTHNPAHWKEEVLKMTNVDLTLSGHTHAMQMAVGTDNHRWSPAVWRYKEWGGMYRDEKKNMNLYVNIGAGEVGMPARLGSAYPEITVINLRK